MESKDVVFTIGPVDQQLEIRTKEFLQLLEHLSGLVLCEGSHVTRVELLRSTPPTQTTTQVDLYRESVR